MTGRAYPLEAALLDRRSKRSRREGELAAALRAVTRAESAAADAQARLRARLAARPQVAERGQASGRELRREAAFERRHAREIEALRAALAAADALVEQARAAVERARSAVADAHAGERAIDRDRERHLLASRKRERDAEQDELDDRLAARPRPR